MLSPRGFSLQSIPDKNKIELRKININFYDYTQDKKLFEIINKTTQNLLS